MTLEESILNLLGQPDYVPMTALEIAGLLKITPKDQEAYQEEIEELLHVGKIARLKKDRFCLPKDADLIAGRIIFRQSGSAILIPESAPNTKAADGIRIAAEDTWVAMHKDRVLIRLNPKNRRRFRGRHRDANPDEETGRVIRVLERARENITGTLKRGRMFYYVIPDDPRIIQDILVPDPEQCKVTPKPKLDDKVVVRMEPWEQRHMNPEGEIIEVLGQTHTPGAEHLALLRQYGLDPEFPDALMTEVSQIPAKVPAEAREGRLDLRDVFTFTIDPDDAKDFDDALSIENLENGETRIGIHIADVSAYVKPGTELDKEAQNRGNSTYLVGQVIPMLPHALSNGICSLVEDEDRLTKSVFVTFSPKGQVKETSFANTVIRSNKRLSYQQAFAMLGEDDIKVIRALPTPPAYQTGSAGRPLAELTDDEILALQQGIRTLWRFASKMRAKRMSAGSLDLDMIETKIYLDEQGYADRIVVMENDESHQLIEEYMLFANEAVAKAMRKAQIPIIHRVHDEPDPDKLDELREFLNAIGIPCGDLSKRSEVVDLLAFLKDHSQGYTLRIEFLRSMRQACYRASPDGHYGLNKKDYTHFTSPIRRYSDLIVHRIFDHFLQRHGMETAPLEPIEPYKLSRLSSLAQHISLTEQNSNEAERESRKVKLLEFFERELERPNKSVFEAVITDIKNHGMFIELTESGIFGLIHISTLRDDLYQVTSDGRTLVGRRTRKSYNIGQTVGVSVERVDRFKRQVDFSINSGYQAPRKPAEKKEKLAEIITGKKATSTETKKPTHRNKTEKPKKKDRARRRPEFLKEIEKAKKLKEGPDKNKQIKSAKRKSKKRTAADRKAPTPKSAPKRK